MEFKAISHEFSKKVAIYSAWFVSFFGILVVLAWLLGLENFVTFPTYGFILSYVSAITILIFGICFLNLIYAKRLYFYKFLAFPIKG
jgi:hypothetical protein